MAIKNYATLRAQQFFLQQWNCTENIVYGDLLKL